MNKIETPVDSATFRSGMSRLAAAVNIVTTLTEEGPCGLTASAVCSVTAAPPTLLVCVNSESSVGDHFAVADSLCINTVGPAHVPLALAFGGKTAMSDRFAEGRWRSGLLGAPVLEDCLVSFDCQVTERHRVGTHIVLFAQVMDIHEGLDDTASAYYGRQFHHLKVR